MYKVNIYWDFNAKSLILHKNIGSFGSIDHVIWNYYQNQNPFPEYLIPFNQLPNFNRKVSSGIGIWFSL